ncbi:MAG: hypothetical protein LZF60_70063 [Nitrospira sp.]|nr:MAG: hypothetical protein LZF60_70063 [Nitrospira sp.]
MRCAWTRLAFLRFAPFKSAPSRLTRSRVVPVSRSCRRSVRQRFARRPSADSRSSSQRAWASSTLSTILGAGRVRWYWLSQVPAMEGLCAVFVAACAPTGMESSAVTTQPATIVVDKGCWFIKGPPSAYTYCSGQF